MPCDQSPRQRFYNPDPNPEQTRAERIGGTAIVALSLAAFTGWVWWLGPVGILPGAGSVVGIVFAVSAWFDKRLTQGERDER